MPDDAPNNWREFALVNRERITALTEDLATLRASVHKLRTETQAVRYLADKVADQAEATKTLAGRVESLTRDALRRPTASGLAIVGQYAGIVIATVALVYTLTR